MSGWVVNLWRGGPGVLVEHRTTHNGALREAYRLMRAWPEMRFCNLYQPGAHIERWWMRDHDGVWQPQ